MSDLEKAALEAAISRVIPQFEAKFDATANFEDWPKKLLDSARYALFGGGKRLRPMLALLTAEALVGEASSAVYRWAMALEMVHSYSLIHDDLPAMDNDDFRRGRPTCHKAFDEATAILAGDALLTEAFGIVSELGNPKLVKLLSKAAGGAGMVGGQVLDLNGCPDLAALEVMDQKKTGCLIDAAILGGAIAAGADDEKVQQFQTFSRALGVLFQLTDDLLDADQDKDRDQNSFLHHMSVDAVMARRDALADEAVASLAFLGESAKVLQALVRKVQHRQR